MRKLQFSGFLSVLLVLLGADAFGQSPVANFTASPTSGCAPLVVQFNNTSTGTGLSYQWNFGNSLTSSQQNPSTIYLTAGTYTVSLVVTSSTGATNTKTITNYITVSAPPTVNFYSPDTVDACGPLLAHFTNQTTLNATGGGTYKWDFGDGSPQLITTSSATVTHVYDTCGTFNISLIATNSAGCSQIATKTAYITVFCNPVAAFTSANNTSCTTPVTVNFTGASSTGAVSYSWNFGSGPGYSTPSSSPTSSHTYTSVGTYTVSLIVTNANGCKDTLVKPGYVSTGALVSSFTASDTTVCTGNTISFTNTTTPGTGNSVWYFNGTSTAPGDTSHATNPAHTYGTVGTYVVKLVSTYNNCSDASTRTVTVAQGPVIAFSGSPLGSCTTPLLVNFSNSTTGAASYLWQFGDGGTSSATNPSHNYTAAGQYDVSLIATTAGNGCSDTLTKPAYVKIFQPTAVINGSVNLGCAPAAALLSLNINAPTTLTGYTYSWSWGDGNTTSTTTTTGTHTYNNPGAYTVTVTGTGSGATSGCTFTTTTQVFVGVQPNSGFSISPNDTVCYGNGFTFNNTSTGAVTYQWFFGDGGTSTQTSPVKNYGNPGTYTVKLVASSYGCKDTTIQTVTVLDPKADFTVALQSCGDRRTFCFTNTSVSAGPTVYSWNFGVSGLTSDTSNAASPCYTFPNTLPASYNVSLTVTNLTTGCVNTKTKVVKVFNLDAQFTAADTILCKGETASFTASSNSNYTQYIWKYGDGSPLDTNTTAATSHTYNTAGTYTVKLKVIDIYGCADSLTRTNYIKVSGINNLNFTGTPVSGCEPLSVSFTATGSEVNTTITNYQWYYGQTSGSSSTGTSASGAYIYTIKDTFTVKLVVTTAAGCKDSITKINYIIVKGPKANFTITGGNKHCPGQAVGFSNTSTAAATPVGYQWNFGDPTSGASNSSTVTSPSHTYQNSGTYSVRLIATDANGCKDTLIKALYISDINAAFTLSDSVANCPPLSVNFTNTSDSDSYAATTYFWNFGNGSTTSVTNPSTIYTAPGTYTIKLYASTAYGCIDSAENTVSINSGPTATLTYANTAGCASMTVCFTMTNVLNTTSATVDFEDGTTQNITLNGTNPVTFCHTYTSGGIFTPVVVLSNGSTGCVSIISNPNLIQIGQPMPGFSYAPTSVCQNAPVQFTDTSATPSVPITTWAWDFGQPGTSTDVSSLQNPLYAYTTAGTKTVRLIITDSSGCADTVTNNITVLPQPSIGAGADQSVCIGGSTTLTATGGQNYSWTPSSSGLSCYSCTSPTSTPAGTTTYCVIGTSTTNSCIDTDCITVNVNPQPLAPTVVTPLTYCQNAVAPALTATASAGNTLKWYTVATGGTPLGSAPTPSTTTVGSTTWYVSQTTSGSNGGCEGPRTSITVTITATPGAPVVNSPVNYCRNAPAVPLTATTTGSNALVWYTVATGGTPLPGAPTPSTTTVTTLNYYVSQQSTNGCEGTRSQIQVIINALPAAPAVVTPVSLCQFAASSPLSGTATSGNTLYWYTTATGGTGTSTAPTPPTATTGTTTWYVAQRNNTTTCEGTRSPVVVTVNPKPNVNAGTDQTVCTGSTVTLAATGASGYVWSPSVTCSNVPCSTATASPTATTTYQVIGTSTAGCADTDVVQVAVVTNPAITIAPSAPAICAGGSVSLTASGASTYTWAPAGTLSAATGATVTASPGATITYTVTGSAGTCTGTATVTVTVNPLPAAPLVSTPVTYCQYGPATALTATASGTNTLNWYTQAVGGAALGAAPTPGTGTAGTTAYYVSQTNANNCESPRTQINVVVNPKPNVNAGADVTVCNGATANLAASGATTYAWSPAVSCTGGCANATVTPAATTTYQVIGTANGCTDTDQVVVSVITNPVVTVSPSSATICAGDTVVLTASGGNTYSWLPTAGLTPATGNPVSAHPVTTTTYIVTGVAGTGASCSDTQSVTITVNPVPAAPLVTTPVSYCQFSIATALNASATAGNSIVWFTTATGGVASGTAPVPSTTASGTTTYYAAQQNTASSCTGPRTAVVVTVNPKPTVTAGSDTTLCAGSTTTVSASGAATYVWSPAISCATTACASGTVAPAATTTYTVIGSTSLGCSDTDTVVVNILDNPVVTVSPASATICPNSTAVLTASGAASYTWTGGVACNDAPACSSVTATPTGTTTYTVTGIVTMNGITCQDTAQVQVAVSNNPNIIISGTTTICEGGTGTTLTASGAGTYVWSPAVTCNNTPCSNVSVNPAATTTYTIMGTSGVGCGDTTTVTVTVNPLPVITAATSTPNVCPADSALFTVSPAAGLTFTWSPAIICGNAACSTGYAFPASTTTYVVTGADAAGCSGTASVTVNVYTPPTVTASANPASICPFDSTQLTASGAISYQWINPTAGLSAVNTGTPMASPGATTTYFVKGTDVNGCKDTGSVTVTVQQPPVITAGPDIAICAGTSTTLTAGGGVSYTWSPAATLSSTNTSTTTATPTATATYTVIGIGANGCKDTDAVVVSINPNPVLNAGSDVSVCSGSCVQLSGSLTGVNYFWSPAAGLSNANIPNPQACPSGTTVYQAVVFDLNGCTDTDAVQVSVLPLPAIDAGPDQQVCRYGSVQLTATGGESYVWSSPNNSLSNTTTPNPIATPPANTVYTVIGTGTNGCADTDQVSVTLYNQQPVSAGPDLTICEGETVQLTATGGNMYVWTPPTGLSNPNIYNPTAAPQSTITYTVIGTDANSCSDTDEITISVIPKVAVSAGPATSEICSGQSVQLFAAGGTSYLWIPAAGLDDPTSSDPVAMPAATTTYSVIITQGACFSDTVSVTINVNPNPEIELGPDQTIYAGSTYSFNPQYSNVDTFRWSPPDGLSCTDCPTATATPGSTTTYTVVVTNHYGCSDSDNITLTVICGGNQVWMPNTFSPNGDGVNDRFYAHGKGVSRIEHFRIYSRWGEVVYEATNIPIDDIAYSWDGTFKGVPLKPDVYVYVLEAICGTGDPIQLKGDITIVR